MPLSSLEVTKKFIEQIKMNAKPTSKITDESTESRFEDQPADRLNEIKTSDVKSAPSESPVIEK